MKDVWLVATRPKKFALAIVFVSKGRISCSDDYHVGIHAKLNMKSKITYMYIHVCTCTNMKTPQSKKVTLMHGLVQVLSVPAQYLSMLMTSYMYTLQREIPHIRVMDNICNLIPLHIIIKTQTPRCTTAMYMYINTMSLVRYSILTGNYGHHFLD